MRRVIVTIDRIVLRGIRYEDRHAVSAALQDELARALAAPYAAQQLRESRSMPRLVIGNVNFGANAKPNQVGAETGRAVGQGLLK